MRKGLASAHRAALLSLFDEAQVRRGFYGGIIGRDRDCARVGGLLAIYAFAMWEDVVVLCEGRPLALLACHEGDIHVHSPDKPTLSLCRNRMRELGLKPYRGGVPVFRHFRMPKPDPPPKIPPSPS